MDNLNDIRKQCDILYVLSLTPPHTLSVDLPEIVLHLPRLNKFHVFLIHVVLVHLLLISV
jgi:hypothetical protein